MFLVVLPLFSIGWLVGFLVSLAAPVAPSYLIDTRDLSTLDDK